VSEHLCMTGVERFAMAVFWMIGFGVTYAMGRLHGRHKG